MKPGARIFSLRTAPGRVACLVLAGLALLGGAPAGAHEPPVIIRQPVAGVGFLNPCTGEGLTISDGSLQLLTHVTEDDAGGLHLSIRGSAQGVVAEGDVTGRLYRLAGDFWSESNIGLGGLPFTTTLVEVHNVISAGASENVMIHILWHLTVDPNGVVRGSVDSLRTECGG